MTRSAADCRRVNQDERTAGDAQRVHRTGRTGATNDRRADVSTDKPNSIDMSLHGSMKIARQNVAESKDVATRLLVQEGFVMSSDLESWPPGDGINVLCARAGQRTSTSRTFGDMTAKRDGRSGVGWSNNGISFSCTAGIMASVNLPTTKARPFNRTGVDTKERFIDEDLKFP